MKRTKEELNKLMEEYDKALFENTNLTNAEVENAIKKIVELYETQRGWKLTYIKGQIFEQGIKEAIKYFFDKEEK